MPTKKPTKTDYRKPIYAIRYVIASDLFTQKVMELIIERFIEVDDPTFRDTVAIAEFLKEHSENEEHSEQLRKELTWARAEVNAIPEGLMINMD